MQNGVKDELTGNVVSLDDLKEATAAEVRELEECKQLREHIAQLEKAREASIRLAENSGAILAMREKKCPAGAVLAGGKWYTKK